MKRNILKWTIGIVLLCFLFSCKKNVSPQLPVNNGTQLIRIQQGTDSYTDTVYLITYNNANKIDKITDSTHHTTLSASYGADGKLSAVTTDFGLNTSYIYDVNGLLTNANITVAGETEQFVFVYVNNIISEKKWYTNVSAGGGLSLWETFKYTVTDGNITNIKEYRYDSTLVSDREFTYDPELNPFKELSLFNFANNLGADEIFNADTYFNKNVLTGYVVDGFNESNENLYTDNNLLAIIEASVLLGNAADYRFLTWQFSYK